MARIIFKRNFDPLVLANDRAKKVFELKKQFENGEIPDKWIDLGEWNGSLSEIKNITLDIVEDEIDKVMKTLPDLSQEELRKLYNEYKMYPAYWMECSAKVTRKDYFFNKHKLVTVNGNGELCHFKTKETPHYVFAKDWMECEHKWNQLVEYARKIQGGERKRNFDYQFISANLCRT